MAFQDAGGQGPTVPGASPDCTSALGFSPVASLLAAASWDGQLRCWDVPDSLQVHQPDHTSPDCTSALSFSPVASLLAAASWDGQLRCWDVPDSLQVCWPLMCVLLLAGLSACWQLPPGTASFAAGTSRTACRCGLSRDSRCLAGLLAVVSWDGQLRCWDVMDSLQVC